MAILLKNFSIFSRCVDWGISNPYCVRVIEVNSLHTSCPERGWKHTLAFLNVDFCPAFTNHLPRKGMETLGPLHPLTRTSADFTNHLPQKGMETPRTLSIIELHASNFTPHLPRKGMETHQYLLIKYLLTKLYNPLAPIGD